MSSLRDRLKPNLGPQTQFNHSHKILPQELTAYLTDKGRFYITPSGNHVPSATTVLGATEDKSWLDKWKARVGEAEANKIRNQSAQRGTALHDRCERYLLGQPDYLEGCDPLVLSFVKQIKVLLDDHVTNVYGTEICLWSEQLRVAGRADAIVDFDGVPSILDFKNARYAKKSEDIQSYWKQTCIYAMMAYEAYSMPVKQLVILMAVEGENGPGLIYKQKVSDHMKETISTLRRYHSPT